MSQQNVVNTIEKLTRIHDDLLKTSIKKTEILKKGDTDALQPILATERQLTHKLEQAEKYRLQAVNEWFDNNAPGEEATVTNMLENVYVDEKSTLEEATTALIEGMDALKQQEQLNISLLEQSMQFIQLSLDMLQPTLSNMNYGQQADTTSNTPSIFDSKA